MKMKPILLVAAAGLLMLGLSACDPSKYGKVEQGRVIEFDETAKTVTVIHDSAMDPANPRYDVVPPATFKLPADEKEIGPLPKPGKRLKLDLDKKQIEIYDVNKQDLAYVDINILDRQDNIDKEHALVKDKKFPQISDGKITIYSGRLKTLCTFTVPTEYAAYPPETWEAGDEVRIYFKDAGQALRFMNITKTNIFKR